MTELNLSSVSTRDLVEELSGREAVKKIIAEPYEKYKIIVGINEIAKTGPAIILEIWD